MLNSSADLTRPSPQGVPSVRNALLLVLALTLFALLPSATVQAQNQAVSTPSSDAWNAVPDSDLIACFNVRRIVAEALPRVMGSDEVAKKDLEHGLEDLW